MKKHTHFIVFIILFSTISSCKYYSFTGGNVGNAKTIQVDYFQNNAAEVKPTLSQQFTQGLQDLFLKQTNLTLVNSGGDLQFSGEITNYIETPISPKADQTSAQTRLTISVNVRYVNQKKEKDNFERTFSYFYDYDATTLLIGDALQTAFTVIIENITKQIFNESIAKW